MSASANFGAASGRSGSARRPDHRPPSRKLSDGRSASATKHVRRPAVGMSARSAAWSGAARTAAWSGTALTGTDRALRFLLQAKDECQTDRTMDFVYIALALLFSGILALAVLTAFGARRRGRGAFGAASAGLFFPVAWAVWYVNDELSNRQARASSI